MKTCKRYCRQILAVPYTMIRGRWQTVPSFTPSDKTMAGIRERCIHLPDVLKLATALQVGEQLEVFALRDALLEAGEVKLARHFEKEEHTIFCWALQAITGRCISGIFFVNKKTGK